MNAMNTKNTFCIQKYTVGGVVLSLLLALTLLTGCPNPSVTPGGGTLNIDPAVLLVGKWNQQVMQNFDTNTDEWNDVPFDGYWMSFTADGKGREKQGFSFTWLLSGNSIDCTFDGGAVISSTIAYIDDTMLVTGDATKHAVFLKEGASPGPLKFIYWDYGNKKKFLLLPGKEATLDIGKIREKCFGFSITNLGSANLTMNFTVTSDNNIEGDPIFFLVADDPLDHPLVPNTPRTDIRFKPEYIRAPDEEIGKKKKGTMRAKAAGTQAEYILTLTGTVVFATC